MAPVSASNWPCMETIGACESKWTRHNYHPSDCLPLGSIASIASIASVASITTVVSFPLPTIWNKTEYDRPLMIRRNTFSYLLRVGQALVVGFNSWRMNRVLRLIFIENGKEKGVGRGGEEWRGEPRERERERREEGKGGLWHSKEREQEQERERVKGKIYNEDPLEMAGPMAIALI